MGIGSLGVIDIHQYVELELELVTIIVEEIIFMFDDIYCNKQDFWIYSVCFRLGCGCMYAQAGHKGELCFERTYVSSLTCRLLPETKYCSSF